MLNLNLNIIECQRRAIAPVTITNFDYILIGGGGGGAAGQGATGGYGGAGGSIISGSIDVSHFAGKIDLFVGAGGVGGTAIGLNGTNGASSSLFYNDSLIQIATGGAAGANASESVRGGKTSPYDSTPTGGGDYLWVQDGLKGGDSPTGNNGAGGGTGNQKFPWGTSPFLTTSNGFTNSGGGGGGLRWDEFNPGGGASSAMGAAGMCMLRLYDPRNIFTYTGDWEVLVEQNGYKYFYYQTNGTFSFFGKRD